MGHLLLACHFVFEINGLLDVIINNILELGQYIKDLLYILILIRNISTFRLSLTEI